MAIQATAVWEAETGGATTNGAGFDAGIAGAGTDFTQQAAAQLSLTDLATSGAGVTTVTSATGGFTSTMVGNALHFNSGTNVAPGYYFITVFTNTNTVTVDRAPDSGGAISAGNGKVGGAHSDPGLLAASIVGGNTMYVKNGTYTITSATQNVAGGTILLPAGTAANPTMLIGYSASRAIGNTGTKPLLQISAIATFTIVTCGTNSHVDNISVDGAAAVSSKGISGGATSSRIYRCKAANCTNNGIDNSGTGGNVCILCEATGCSTQVAIKGAILIACTAHDNTISGFGASNTGSLHVDCISSNNSGASSDGFQTSTNTTTWVNCVAYNNGRDGFRLGAGAFHGECINCIAEANAGFQFNESASTGNAFLFNSGGKADGSGLVGANIPTANRIGLITATTEIFNNAAGNDFSLNNTGTGGGLFRAAGIPSNTAALQLPGLSSLSFPDAGAIQTQAAAAAGAAIVPNNFMLA